ncbi:hypothetical protein PO124_30200 [Bacillus licheniformis]|nr:hypothetical protein [Bacillus licheniformis]
MNTSHSRQPAIIGALPMATTVPTAIPDRLTAEKRKAGKCHAQCCDDQRLTGQPLRFN